MVPSSASTSACWISPSQAFTAPAPTKTKRPLPAPRTDADSLQSTRAQPRRALPLLCSLCVSALSLLLLCVLRVLPSVTVMLCFFAAKRLPPASDIMLFATQAFHGNARNSLRRPHSHPKPSSPPFHLPPPRLRPARC